MTHPSHSSPSSGFPSASASPHPLSPPKHSSRPQYSHSPPDNYFYTHNNSTSPMHPLIERKSLHSLPYPADPYYYPEPPPTHHSQTHTQSPHLLSRYRPQRPPPPHPPAPPAPPRQLSYNKYYQQSQPSTLPSLLSTVSYYRAHTDPDGHPSNPVLGNPPHLGLDTEEREDAPRSDKAFPRSASSVGGRDSEIREHGEDDVAPTPSPIDPARIQQWEEVNGQHISSGPGSHHGDDDDGETNTTSLAGTQHGFYDGRPVNLGIDPSSASLDMPYSQQRPNSDYYPSAHHQAQFQALTQNTGSTNTQRGSIGLNSLVDGEPFERPPYPLPTIIRCAILGSPHQQLTLSELYLAMEMRFKYYKNSDKKSWRNSVRHNLSLNNQFAKKERPITEPGKGHYWVVVPDMPQGNKRERKRNKKPGKRAQAEAARGDSKSSLVGAPEIIINSHLSPTTVVSPAALIGYAGTLPASAGSYAAVTGAEPAPPPLDRQLFRPWNGNISSSNPTTATLADAALRHPSYVATSSIHEDQRSQSPTRAASEHRPDQTQFGESSLGPSVFASPALPNTASLSRLSESSSAESSGSASDDQIHLSAMRLHERFGSTVPVLVAPQDAFSQLAAQIEREGIKATGRGGPGIAPRKRRRGRAISGEWDSEEDDPSDDDEYLPHKKKTRVH